MSRQKILRCLILAGLCLRAVLPVRAQEFPMIRFTQRDGLPSDMVYDVFQEDNGYLWFATNAGISRYNGIQFENFSIKDGLPDNECFFFRKDLYGRLWIATYNGALAFYKDGVFHTAGNTAFLKLPFRGEPIRNIEVNKDSSVSIIFRTFPALVVIRNNRSKVYNIDRRYPLPSSGALFSTANFVDIKVHGDNLYRVVGGKTEVIADEKGKARRITEFPHRSLRWLCSNPEEEFYTDDSLVYNSAFRPCFIIPRTIREAGGLLKISAHAGTLFFATTQGLWIDSLHVLRNISVSNVIRDSGGCYWISTLGHGVYKLSGNFRNSPVLRDAYRTTVVDAAGRDSGFVFSTRNMDVYTYNSRVRCLFDYERQKGGMFRGMRYAAFSDGRYHLSSTGRQYRLLDLKQESRPLWGSDTLLGNYRLLYVRPWLYGISFYKVAVMNYDRFLATKQLHASWLPLKGTMPYSGVYSAAPGPDSSVWISTSSGLYRVKGHHMELLPQFRGVFFRSFTFTKHCLAGYTLDNELLVCDPSSPATVIESLPREKGIWDRFYRLNDSCVILTTNRDYQLIVTRAPGRGLRFSMHTLDHPFIPQSAEYIYSDGSTCYFFRDRSIYRFPIRDLLAEHRLPRVFFTGLESGRGLSRNSVDSLIRLPHAAAGNIRISFSAIATNDPVQEYEYCIAADDDTARNWVRTGEAFVNLHNINPGTYHVLLRGRTPCGRCSPAASFMLVVGPPWWRTSWFMASALVAFLGLVALLVQWRLRRISREKDKELKFLRSEFRALNALMNPHFIFNALNSIQGLVKKEHKENAVSYIRTFSDLVRQNMQNISQDLVTIEKEMQLVRNYLDLEQLRFKSWLRYEIDIDDEVETEDVLVPPLLIQPLVENAIKHGLWAARTKEGLIRIHIFKEQGTIVVEVTDNGPGLHKQNDRVSHQSMALTNIRERLRKLSELHRLNITLDIAEIEEGDQVKGVRASLRIYE